MQRHRAGLGRRALVWLLHLSVPSSSQRPSLRDATLSPTAVRHQGHPPPSLVPTPSRWPPGPPPLPPFHPAHSEVAPHGDLVTIHTLLEIPTVGPSSRRDPRQPPAGSGRLGTLQSLVPEAGHSLPPSGPAHRVPAAGDSQPAPRVCLLLQTSLLSAPGKVPALSGCSWPVGLGGHGSHPVPRGRDHTHDAHIHVHAHTCTHTHA